jgi:effector-binding domain-containing protein
MDSQGDNRMSVDFSLKKVPSYRVASIVRIGTWKEDNLRTEFKELTRWAQRNGIRTGRWFFLDTRPNHRRWEACLEIRGKATPEGRIRLKTLPASWVARVVFDPDVVSSRLVYHGLNDWTKWRRIYKEIRSVASVREVYTGDPWKDKRAWAHCEVQFLVRK